MTQVQSPYTGGTATVAAGGTTVTVTGILDDTNCIEGDHFRDPATGYETRILQRTDATHFTIPPYRGAALTGAAYQIYPDSTLRISAGRNTATVNTLITRLKDKGIAWVLPAGYADPTAAGWGADESQQVYQPATGKWWSMQSGTWTIIAAPSGIQATNILPAGTDLNNVTTSGFYRLQSGNINGPSGSYDFGQMIVTRGSDTIGQIIIPYNNGNLWFRGGSIAASPAWTAWNSPVNKSGDTMTGDLTIQKSTQRIVLINSNGATAYTLIGNTSNTADNGFSVLRNGAGLFTLSADGDIWTSKIGFISAAYPAIPNTGGGAGRVWSAFSASAGSGVTLPSGGTWLAITAFLVAATGAFNSLSITVAAGGSTIGATSGFNVSTVAWRIA